MWPIQHQDGSPVVVLGRELWMTLSAPADGHPEQRHDRARIRLLAKSGDRWEDLGNVFADGASLGSREWSGSAILRPDGSISVFYTAAGRRGEARPTFHQLVAEAQVQLRTSGGTLRLEGDAEHRVILQSDGDNYLPADEIDGGPGQIRAFRDPSWFRDPADRQDYLLVAASTRWENRFSGAVGIARANCGGWDLLPPLVVADGINHELERPHVIVHEGRYYLFFCTTRHGFHPPHQAPTGLYGFVAPTLLGPYEPLNDSGLVLQNPPAQPDRTYAWLVLPDLRVVSFVNYLSTNGVDLRHAAAEEARAQFGGTAAPFLTLTLTGATATFGPTVSVRQAQPGGAASS